MRSQEATDKLLHHMNIFTSPYLRIFVHMKFCRTIYVVYVTNQVLVDRRSSTQLNTT